VSSAGASIGILLGVAVFALLIASEWRLFTKAGQPGWAAIVPIYNVLTLLRVVGRPWWWILLWIIPLAGPFILIVHGVMIALDLARSFGKGTGFGVCTIFFSYVTIPILAFGDAVYQGPATGQQYPGQPYPGQQYGGQQYPGQPYQAQQYGARPYQQPQYPPAQQYPGQQYPPQPYPGQQPGGYAQPPQQYPGQQYPGQYPPQ
jgi:hypothetical protein